MSEKPRVTDAEFEVVSPGSGDLTLHAATLLASLVTFSVAFYFGATTPPSGQALWIGAAGASFAAAVRAAWKLFPALRARRRARENGRALKASDKLPDLRG